MVTVVQGKVCAKNHPHRLSRLATDRRTDGRTDRQTDFLWHRPDLTVGQKCSVGFSCKFYDFSKFCNFYVLEGFNLVFEASLVLHKKLTRKNLKPPIGAAVPPPGSDPC